MSNIPARSFTLLAAAIVVAAIIVSATLFVALGTSATKTSISTQVSKSTVTTTSTLVSTETITSTLSPSVTPQTNLTSTASSGLQLRVDLNSTVMSYAGTVTAQITLFNSLGQNLSLTPSYASNSTIAKWNSYDFFCSEPVFSSMIGYALFQGYYTSANASTAGSPEQLSPPVGIGCVTYPNPVSIVFLPNSGTAALYPQHEGNPDIEQVSVGASTESCSMNSAGAYVCGLGQGLSGYWNATGLQGNLQPQNATTDSQYFHYLSPGWYTLAVQDMWNQTVYAHLQVVSSIGNPVEVVSVTGPIPPYNPGGPVVSIVLENVGGTSVVSLSATPKLNSAEPSVSYTFVFDVNAASPLLPDYTVQDTRTLIGAGFQTGTNYPLTISGTFANGTSFSSTVLVQILPPTSTTSNGSAQLHKVTFQQEGACSPSVYVAPWSVTLGTITEAEPPGTPLPILNGGYSAGPEPSSIYTIVFSVPNGTYQYSVRPQGAFYAYSGTVTVNGADVLITLNGPAISCTTTTGAG